MSTMDILALVVVAVVAVAMSGGKRKPLTDEEKLAVRQRQALDATNRAYHNDDPRWI